MTYLKVRKILEIIDEKFAYAPNKEVQQILDKLPKDDPNKHVISRKTWVKYVNEYKEIRRKELGVPEHDLLSIDKIVRKEGLGTSGTKYHKDDVTDIINHKVFYRRIENAFIDKTISLQERDDTLLQAFNVKAATSKTTEERIPKVFFEYVEGSIQEEEDRLLNIIIDELIDREKVRNDAIDHLLSSVTINVDPKNYLK